VAKMAGVMKMKMKEKKIMAYQRKYGVIMAKQYQQQYLSISANDNNEEIMAIM